MNFNGEIKRKQIIKENLRFLPALNSNVTTLTWLVQAAEREIGTSKTLKIINRMTEPWTLALYSTFNMFKVESFIYYYFLAGGGGGLKFWI